jgi:OmpA-OmpF porin, OOP family
LQGFPAYVSLPKSVLLYDEGSLIVENLAEVEFPLAEGKKVTKTGKHYRSYLKFGPEEFNRPAAATWKEWRPALEAGRFVLQGSDGATTYTMLRKAGGMESWLRIGLGDYESPIFQLIEIGAPSAGVTLTPPQAQPEKFGAQDDFPYFTAPAGAKISGTSTFGEPLDVTVQGTDQEQVLIGTGYKIKTYTPPPSLSRFEFETLYRAALAKAGWTVKPPPPGTQLGEAGIVANYNKNGRNLWLTASRGADDSNIGLTVKVADVGAEDWGNRLDQDCRLPLYGITFDFNKDTLRPDSFPLLEKARAALAARPTVKIEVQGHTDNVGQADYNLKLSEARAKAVVGWLVGKGIPADRLTSRGYGASVPIADNGSPAGRAINRRVELVSPACQR